MEGDIEGVVGSLAQPLCCRVIIGCGGGEGFQEQKQLLASVEAIQQPPRHTPQGDESKWDQILIGKGRLILKAVSAHWFREVARP